MTQTILPCELLGSEYPLYVRFRPKADTFICHNLKTNKPLRMTFISANLRHYLSWRFAVMMVLSISTSLTAALGVTNTAYWMAYILGAFALIGAIGIAIKARLATTVSTIVAWVIFIGYAVQVIPDYEDVYLKIYTV